MPIQTLHLLTLHTPLPTFLHALHTLPVPPILISLPHRWIISPSTSLLAREWDLLLILPSSSLPSTLSTHIDHHFTLRAGIPSSLLSTFFTRNHTLLHPSPSSIPSLTGSLDAPKIANSAQDLELSRELRDWIEGDEAPRGAVTMLNFLTFREGTRGEYLKYGKAFAESIGARRGGEAKLVGKAVEEEGGDSNEEGWEEIALAHYPSLEHFADMLASQDYQEVNQRHRVPSLRNTCILCTSEIDIEKIIEEGGRAKL